MSLQVSSAQGPRCGLPFEPKVCGVWPGGLGLPQVQCEWRCVPGAAMQITPEEEGGLHSIHSPVMMPGAAGMEVGPWEGGGGTIFEELKQTTWNSHSLCRFGEKCPFYLPYVLDCAMQLRGRKRRGGH